MTEMTVIGSRIGTSYKYSKIPETHRTQTRIHMSGSDAFETSNSRIRGPHISIRAMT